MKDLRSRGPRALDEYLTLHGPAPAPALDAVCAQHDAHTTLLYWFTDLRAALAEAGKTGKPVLSLRLLGRLDQPRSCANSRFFRRLLYPEPRINAVLRRDFVLHWQSLRPVPLVTIDLGDGRKIEKPITGNSVHVVLDARGRVVDALPGLCDPDAFLTQLVQARAFATADRRDLASLHDRARRSKPPPRVPSRAVRASAIAASKHVVEGPLLAAISPPLATDTRAGLQLHHRVHDAFARNTEWAGIDGFVEWIYAELFEMPLSDPMLGLDVPDPV
jgi:hypothetical protein